MAGNFQNFQSYGFPENFNDYGLGKNTKVTSHNNFQNFPSNDHFQNFQDNSGFQNFNKVQNFGDYDNEDSNNDQNNSNNNFNNYSNNQSYGGGSKTNKSFDLENLKRELLETHNQKRALHGVQKLTANPRLDQIAQRYADKLAQTNSFQHSGDKFDGQPMGENLFMQGGRQMTGDYCTNSWYDEIKDYNFNNPERKTGVVGHFTQLVWKGSREVGFGCGVSSDGAYYIVANYFPAGNYVGDYPKNVLPPQ